jgi:hypothetical protein
LNIIASSNAGHKNGGLIYSHFQNSPTVLDNPTKLGGGVEIKLLENRGIGFLQKKLKNSKKLILKILWNTSFTRCTPEQFVGFAVSLVKIFKV